MKKMTLHVVFHLILATAFTQPQPLISAGIGMNSNMRFCITADAGIVLNSRLCIAATGTLNAEAIYFHTEGLYVGFNTPGCRSWQFLAGIGNVPNTASNKKLIKDNRKTAPLLGISFRFYQIEISARYTGWNASCCMKYMFKGRADHTAPLIF